MLLRARGMAFLGLLLAFSVLLVVLGGVLESSTLFFLSGASFCVGIAIRELGIRLGAGFLLASTLLSFMLAPNKIYCFTFAAMGLYILLTEYFWEKLASAPGCLHRDAKLWIAKFIVFNLMFIPGVLLFPKLVYAGELNTGLIVLILCLGQGAWFLYDGVYRYFQKTVWGKFRVRIQFR